MIPSRFEYVRPDDLSEALSALADGGEDAKIMAGGQSLIPLMRLRLAYPSVVVDIGAISELRSIRDEGDTVVIGAMAPHAEVLASPVVRQHVPLLICATQTVADRQVRHLGTLGGALAHADPAGDLPAVAVALNAEFVLAGPGGQRTVKASEFFVDFLQTALAPNEVLTEVRFPKLGEGWGVHYEKFHRVAQAWAIVGVAAAVRRDNGTITEARVGLTNMGSTPVRASAVETALAGAPGEMGAVREAAEHAADGTSPPSDTSAGADYRAHLARVLTARALAGAGRLS